MPNLRLVSDDRVGQPSLTSWTCSVCKKSIPEGKGYVVVMDAKTASYPKMPPSGEPREGFLSASEIFAPLPEHVKILAYHGKCDPHPNTDPYWIPIERAQTLEDWCAWVHHLCGKGWMRTQDIADALDYWFINRGDSVYKHS